MSNDLDSLLRTIKFSFSKINLVKLGARCYYKKPVGV